MVTVGHSGIILTYAKKHLSHIWNVKCEFINLLNIFESNKSIS